MKGYGEHRISCEQARELDMVDYLSGLGYEPARIRGNQYWYLSPLRAEKTPSFKINRKLNRWFDFGLGEGGNLIDFAIAYHSCTVGEFLALLEGGIPFHRPLKTPNPIIEEDPNGSIEIVEVKSLYHPALLDYLQLRRIPVTIADRHCREVHYKVREKAYFAIGFANDSGGWELRNPYFKGGNSPKDISTLINGAGELAVLEGYMDFLSLVAIMGWQESYPSDFLILNSLSFFERSLPLMEQYPKVRLYLDNDASGQHCSRIALARSDRFTDESGLYQNHEDLNDWLRHFGNPLPPDMPDAREPP